MARLSVEFVQGFLARLVEVPAPEHFPGHGPCRLWSAATHPDGHGKVSVDGETQYAHRVAFRIAHGREPGPLLRHLCGRHGCCNDAHLREGTGAQNLADSVAHGTYSPPPHPCGSTHPESKLSSADVAHLWTMVEHGYTQQEIANALHISQPLVSAILNGKARTCRR